MALALYRVLTLYALTVNSGDMTGQYPATMVVPQNTVFVGNTGDPLLAKYVAAKLLASSAPGTTTVGTFFTQVTTPPGGA